MQISARAGWRGRQYARGDYRQAFRRAAHPQAPPGAVWSFKIFAFDLGIDKPREDVRMFLPGDPILRADGLRNPTGDRGFHDATKLFEGKQAAPVARDLNLKATLPSAVASRGRR